MFKIDTKKYIEIPFEEHGRDFEGCDCYGLVRLIYKNEFNKDLPLLINYKSTRDNEQIQKLIDIEKPLLNAKKIEEPTIGCVAIFTMRGFATHMGVYIGKNMILHVMRGTNSLCERLNSYRLRGRLEGYYEIG